MNKILIIDDEKNIQVSLSAILQDEDFQVFVAASGEEGVEKFSNIRPHLVFLDIWLPGIDGLETMKQLLSMDPFLIIVMISGHGNISTAVTAVKSGAYDFLEKPLDLDKVVFSVKRGLEYRKLIEENRKLKSMLEERAEIRIEDRKKKNNKTKTGILHIPNLNGKHLRKQRTVKKSNIFYGMGLHSGEKTGMVIKPLEPNQGIRFENISSDGYVPARVEYIDTTAYATSIKKDGLEAKTIEHLMAALHAAGITNLSIKINKEVPIGDGSANKFCEFVRESGIEEQEAFIQEIIINEPLLIGTEGPDEKFIRIEPFDGFVVDYTAIYPEPLGRIHYHFIMNSFEDFEREIAPARTYGFVEDMTRLGQMGLAEGGRVYNFIMIDQGKVLNTELRFPDELPRHKILDIIGDFYLLGRPIRGKITAQKTGHSENALMVKRLEEVYVKK